MMGRGFTHPKWAFSIASGGCQSIPAPAFMIARNCREQRPLRWQGDRPQSAKSGSSSAPLSFPDGARLLPAAFNTVNRK